jgi:hypothetical protein
LQVFDIEIKPLKAVKGQRLCKLIGGIEAMNFDSLSMNNNISIQDEMMTKFEWYKDIIFYLKFG